MKSKLRLASCFILALLNTTLIPGKTVVQRHKQPMLRAHKLHRGIWMPVKGWQAPSKMSAATLMVSW